jgi:predicted porin
MDQTSWVLQDTTNQSFKGARAPRRYVGADFQFAIKTKIGTTTLRGEYITGVQSGQVDDTRSPISLPTKQDTYIRNFSGAYAYFVQRIAQTKHEIALKYEYYDPNSKLDQNALNANTGYTKAELKYTMLGVGYNYYFNDNCKFMLYYNIVRNETSTHINGFDQDLKDDVLTVRMQFRF